MMQLRWIRWVLIILAIGAITAIAQQSAPESSASSARAEATPAATAAPEGTSAPEKASSSRPVLGERHPRYILQAGDSFDLSFDLSPEFNQSVTVQPDGYVSLRGVGDVHVAGQTVPQLTETLKKSYGKILNDPIISVFLKDFEKPYFTGGRPGNAAGQIRSPGRYHGDAGSCRCRRRQLQRQAFSSVGCSGAFPISGSKPAS